MSAAFAVLTVIGDASSTELLVLVGIQYLCRMFNKPYISTLVLCNLSDRSPVSVFKMVC